MTNLERILIEKLEETEEELERHRKFASQFFDDNVRMSGVLCAIEDHLILLRGGDNPPRVFMEDVVDSEESNDFKKIYEYFKCSLEMNFNGEGEDDEYEED